MRPISRRTFPPKRKNTIRLHSRSQPRRIEIIIVFRQSTTLNGDSIRTAWLKFRRLHDPICAVQLIRLIPISVWPFRAKCIKLQLLRIHGNGKGISLPRPGGHEVCDALRRRLHDIRQVTRAPLGIDVLPTAKHEMLIGVRGVGKIPSLANSAGPSLYAHRLATICHHAVTARITCIKRDGVRDTRPARDEGHVLAGRGGEVRHARTICEQHSFRAVRRPALEAPAVARECARREVGGHVVGTGHRLHHALFAAVRVERDRVDDTRPVRVEVHDGIRLRRQVRHLRAVRVVLRLVVVVRVARPLTKSVARARERTRVEVRRHVIYQLLVIHRVDAVRAVRMERDLIRVRRPLRVKIHNIAGGVCKIVINHSAILITDAQTIFGATPFLERVTRSSDGRVGHVLQSLTHTHLESLFVRSKPAVGLELYRVGLVQPSRLVALVPAIRRSYVINAIRELGILFFIPATKILVFARDVVLRRQRQPNALRVVC